MSKIKNPEPYQQAYYPPTPTAFTKFMRTFIPWQFVRFLIITGKMLKMMVKTKH
ncbi:hypothetical protein [Polynucleobacter sphagniphilus]|uniref:hypothetical protein n=1 Tax=Polynucleobacter sphagniphilus TaxID=1743169 RepID=UPI002404C6E5|nr:hypothetical protein [Polynucleobacter sphagniphilus]MDF9789177.1 hypothetical protein [Polynucleobacter sphagniphilus]